MIINQNFQGEGWGMQNKKTSVGEYRYFLELQENPEEKTNRSSMFWFGSGVGLWANNPLP